MGSDPPPVNFPILFESDGYLAIDKPAGWLVIPGREPKASLPSIHHRLQSERGVRLWVVHRLDRDTSGVLLYAKNALAHRTLSLAFERGEVAKEYLALALGKMASPVRVDFSLVPARRGRMRLAREGELGKEAVTEFCPLHLFSKHGLDVTLVKAIPKTGRTHQIRVHLAACGHPLLYDAQYGRGEECFSLQRTPLHAFRLTIPPGPGVEGTSITAAMPQDMQRAVELLA